MDENKYIHQSRETRAKFVQELVAKRHIVSSKCEDAFRSIPREHFVESFDIPGFDGTFTHYDVNESEYIEFLEAVYTDNTLLTLYDDQGTPTSSSTTPSLMATMLELLSVSPGENILEVGFGTGYNTALICHMTRDDRTVSAIDVESSLVSRGENVLFGLGYYPTLVSGDGQYGISSRSPYDGIIATCGTYRVPSSWIHQVRSGGRIVVNVSFGLARLDVDNNGIASGRFLQPAGFIRMRSNEEELSLTHRDLLNMEDCTRLPTYSSTVIQMSTYVDQVAQFLRKLYFPELLQVVLTTNEGPRYTLYDPVSQSWAQATPDGSGSVLVAHKGPRDLWDELLDIIDNWERLDRPSMERYGLTVYPDGLQLVWLDDVSNVVGSL